MAIPIRNVIDIPQKTLDSWWVYHTSITSPVGGEASAALTVVPYNSETLEFDMSLSKQVNIPNIMEKISNGDAVLAQAMGAILAAVGAKVAEVELEEELDPNPNPMGEQ